MRSRQNGTAGRVAGCAAGAHGGESDQMAQGDIGQDQAVSGPVAPGEAALAAALWGGGDSGRLIGARENEVREIVGDAGRIALRLHRAGYQTQAAIRSELWWTGALAEAGVSVPRPVPTRDGTLIAQLPSGRLATAVTWVEGAAIGAAGVPLAGNLDEQAVLHRALGGLLARLHVATDALLLPEWFTRPRWDLDGLVGSEPFWGRFWDHPELTVIEHDVLGRARAHLRGILADQAAGTADFGLIHADVLRENVLCDLVPVAGSGEDASVGRGFLQRKSDGARMNAGGVLTLIDFDDSGFGFRGYDLGTALSQSLAEPGFRTIVQSLVQGYEAVRPLGSAARLLPEFTLMRCCASVGWAAARVAQGEPVHRIYIERAVGLARKVLDGRGFG